MTTTTDIETACDAALTQYEAQHGALNETEKLAFAIGFADGMHYGLNVGKACVETQMAIERASI